MDGAVGEGEGEFPVGSQLDAMAGYEASAGNLTGVSLATDMVFSDGVDDQLVTITGSPSSGYDASLVVRV